MEDLTEVHETCWSGLQSSQHSADDDDDHISVTEPCTQISPDNVAALWP